ncbi:MAG: hypothetical protein ACFE0O_14650 [Opitutales bacterium]
MPDEADNRSGLSSHRMTRVDRLLILLWSVGLVLTTWAYPGFESWVPAMFLFLIVCVVALYLLYMHEDFGESRRWRPFLTELPWVLFPTAAWAAGLLNPMAVFLREGNQARVLAREASAWMPSSQLPGLTWGATALLTGILMIHLLILLLPSRRIVLEICFRLLLINGGAVIVTALFVKASGAERVMGIHRAPNDGFLGPFVDPEQALFWIFLWAAICGSWLLGGGILHLLNRPPLDASREGPTRIGEVWWGLRQTGIILLGFGWFTLAFGGGRTGVVLALAAGGLCLLSFTARQQPAGPHPGRWAAAVALVGGGTLLAFGGWPFPAGWEAALAHQAGERWLWGGGPESSSILLPFFQGPLDPVATVLSRTGSGWLDWWLGFGLVGWLWLVALLIRLWVPRRETIAQSTLAQIFLAATGLVAIASLGSSLLHHPGLLYLTAFAVVGALRWAELPGAGNRKTA